MFQIQLKPLLGLCLLGAAVPVLAAPAPRERSKDTLQTVHQFFGSMPTGVTVSQKGRIFVNYPRWGDPVPFTVGEIVKGREVPFPSREMNAFGTKNNRAELSQEKSERAQSLRQTHLVGVQSVVVDAKDRLWVLDTGSVLFGTVALGGPKLVCVDLNTNRVIKTILMPQSVALPKSYLNDIRFDLSQGQNGFAYITDSGVAGIITVDLASGRAHRSLTNHPTTKAEPKFVPFPEGRAMFSTPPKMFPTYVKFQSDGIAISADGSRLFYCPLASRRLYSVSTSALRDFNATDVQVAATIVDHGEKGLSDGLESDTQNRVYCTQPETNSISRRLPNGLFETLVQSDRLLWPDTLSLAGDGYLYVTSNQLQRQKGYNYGKDLRQKPFSLFRVRVADARPVRLK
jgi:sugar lactone lactonase YvrE